MSTFLLAINVIVVRQEFIVELAEDLNTCWYLGFRNNTTENLWAELKLCVQLTDSGQKLQ